MITTEILQRHIDKQYPESNIMCLVEYHTHREAYDIHIRASGTRADYIVGRQVLEDDINHINAFVESAITGTRPPPIIRGYQNWVN